MSAGEPHDRQYIQSRVREEIARAERHAEPFALLTFECLPSSDGVPIRRKIDAALTKFRPRLRPSDVLARAFDDTFVVLLVETDSEGAHDVLMRLRTALIGTGHWTITTFVYPDQGQELLALPMLTAA